MHIIGIMRHVGRKWVYYYRYVVVVYGGLSPWLCISNFHVINSPLAWGWLVVWMVVLLAVGLCIDASQKRTCSLYCCGASRFVAVRKGGYVENVGIGQAIYRAGCGSSSPGTHRPVPNPSNK